MDQSLICREVEALIFDLHRGELTDLRKAMADKHLQQCPACRELALKTDQLFDAAKNSDPADWAEFDADSLFERIEDDISDAPDISRDIDENGRLGELFELASTTDPVDGADIDSQSLFDDIATRIADDEDDEDEQLPSSALPGRRRLWPAAAAAAAACAAILGWWILWPVDGPSEPDHTTETTTSLVESEDSSSTDGDSIHRFASFSSVSSPRKTLQLFADEAATYEFSTTDDGDEIELSEGSILMELTPGSTKSFAVRAQAHTIVVTGTVFSVEIDDDAPRVTVFEGSVDIIDPRGQSHRLEAGEYSVGEEGGEVDEDTYSQVERYIDLAAHGQRLRDATSRASDAGISRVHTALGAAFIEADEASLARPPTEEPAKVDDVDAPPSERVEESSPSPDDDKEDVTEEMSPPKSSSDLHEEALTALHDGQPGRAVDILEEALELTGPSEAARADVLLELARIHLRDLDTPEQAAEYLDQFIEKWPDDPAADAIRSQLCDLGVDGADCP